MPAADQPLVSIVTPAYNQAAFVRATIESVLSQDYPHIEYIVLDDGSSDETPLILNEYTGRLTWESHANMGQTATINKGFQRSRGEIIGWLNSDDTLLPGAVKTAVAFLQEHPGIDIVYGDTLFTKEDGTPIRRTHGRTFDYESFVLNWTNPIPQPSAFIRRTVIEEAGLLDTHYYYFMDWEFWLRAGVRHEIAYIPELLSTYRLHAESKTIAQLVRAAPELEHMFDQYYASGRIPSSLQKRQGRARASMHLTTAAYFRSGGAHSEALKALRNALRSHWAVALQPRAWHKLCFTLLGGSRLYGAARGLFHRIRGR